MIWTTKRIKHNPAYNELEAEIRDKIWVPAYTNLDFLKQYGLAPDQPVGSYIIELKDNIKSEAVDLTRGRARFIMLLTLCGVLHGVREYCFDDSLDGNKVAEEAYDFLLSDDIFAEMSFKGIFIQPLNNDFSKKECNTFVNDLHKRGCYYLKESDRSLYKSQAFSNYDEDLGKFYSRHNGDDDSGFLRDLGRMLCRHTLPEYDARNSFWDVKNPEFQRVYDVCDLMKAVRAMGDQYVLAPVFNLYAESVLRCIQDCKKQLSR